MARRQADANRRSAFAASGRVCSVARSEGGAPAGNTAPRRSFALAAIGPVRWEGWRAACTMAHGWRAAENLGRLVAPSMLAIPEPSHSPGLSPRSV